MLLWGSVWNIWCLLVCITECRNDCIGRAKGRTLQYFKYSTVFTWILKGGKWSSPRNTVLNKIKEKKLKPLDSSVTWRISFFRVKLFNKDILAIRIRHINISRRLELNKTFNTCLKPYVYIVEHPNIFIHITSPCDSFHQQIRQIFKLT